jgi:carbon-monoxide dehydrogenase iron sulfur subunit
MFCEKCGKELPKETTLCPNCGFQPLSTKVRLKNIWRVTLTRGRVPVNGFPTDCVVCESCMNYCSHFHEGSVIPALSRIIIDPTEFEWMMHERELSTVKRTVCQQCPGIAPCMAACKIPGAMYRDDKTGAVIINDEFCTKCRQCEKACPYGAVWYSEARDKMIKCDLCGGEPQCVEVCPVSVLKYEKIA